MRFELVFRMAVAVGLMSVAQSLVFAPHSHACVMSRDPRASFFSSYSADRDGSYSELRAEEPRVATIGRCQSSAGKFLMFALPLRFTKLSSDVRDRSYDGKLVEDGCRIEDSLLSRSLSFSEKQAVFADQFRVLRSCLSLSIKELQGKPLVFSESQAQCQMKAVSPSEVQAEGALCFLSAMPYYQLSVELKINPSCRNREFLKAQGLGPKDIELGVDAYVAGDDSGFSSNLDPIGGNRARYTLLPGGELLPLSGDSRDPQLQWPSVYSVEAHQGSIQLRPMGPGRTSLDLGYLVDNFGSSRCRDGLCSSSADFSQTLAGEVDLLEVLPGGKRRMVDSWIYGNIVPAQWQGILKSPQRIIEGGNLSEQGRFEIRTRMVDPTVDYELWLEKLPQFLIELRSSQGTAGIDVMPVLRTLSELVPLFPVPDLPFLSGEGADQAIQSALAVLNSSKRNSDWPPYYGLFCEQATGVCRKTGRDKVLLELVTQFSTDGLNEDGTLKLKDFVVTRESRYFKSYRKNVKALPSVQCDVPTRRGMR
ncbi:MAG: hypothetical protein RJB38_1464 [Pseudomonadota bacterium]